MRVLMLLSSPFVTGPAELCLSDAAALRAAGHEVLFGVDTRRPGDYRDAVLAAGFEVMEELALCRQVRPVEIARDVLRLRARLAGADLVHCRFSHEHALAVAAGQGMAGSRRPALVRTVEIARTLRPGRLRAASLRACDAVIVPCRAYAAGVERLYGVPGERIHLVPGRVDAERFSPGDGSAMRAELGVASDQVLFGIVSRIKVERLHETLVRAFAAVAAEQPRARLAIVGRGEHEPAIRALVGELRLGDRVHFAGYRAGPALVEAYRALDAKIWLAEGNDGTCRAVLEAMACGKPVLVGDGGALAETVRDGVEGRVVAPRVESVAQGLRSLCDAAGRARMGKAARARAEGFTAARRAEALLDAYAAASERRGR